jgi:hypothetical protein
MIVDTEYKDFLNLSDEEQLRYYIRQSEERYISYKKMLEELFKDKISFPLDSDLVSWYKEHLRDCKNREEIYLKEHRESLTNLRNCLDWPFMYRRIKKSKPVFCGCGYEATTNTFGDLEGLRVHELSKGNCRNTLAIGKFIPINFREVDGIKMCSLNGQDMTEYTLRYQRMFSQDETTGKWIMPKKSVSNNSLEGDW